MGQHGATGEDEGPGSPAAAREASSLESTGHEALERKVQEDAVHPPPPPRQPSVAELERDLRAARLDQQRYHDTLAFLAVLSHQLRNPLAPIKNALHILERAPAGSPQARRATEVIGRQIAQLSHLVEDLLDVSRSTRNKIELHRERTELTGLVWSTVEDHRAAFESAGVEVELDAAPGQMFASADRARLVQLLGHLLHNAAKFTPRGGRVTVSLSASPGEGSAVLHVSDTGVGMAPATLARLFQPFALASATGDRSKGGLGVGLSLVKALAELHGGSVSASSGGLGQGSEIVVHLPLDGSLAGEASPPAETPGRARRVLLIEDNLDAAETLRDALELIGHQVFVAHDGPSGVAMAREVKPEVVLCDVGLPGMDGLGVARALRADEALKGTYLVALTGYTQPGDVEKTRQAGFDEHLAKPPSLDRLEDLLASVPG